MKTEDADFCYQCSQRNEQTNVQTSQNQPNMKKAKTQTNNSNKKTQPKKTQPTRETPNKQKTQMCLGFNQHFQKQTRSSYRDPV